MGLAERKVIKVLEEDDIAKATKELSEITGVDVKIEADWETFGTVDAIRDCGHTGITRLVDGVRKLCGDDLGKEALAEAFKLVRFSYVKGADKKLDYTSGTLSIAGGWGDSLSDIFTDHDIFKFLEENL